MIQLPDQRIDPPDEPQPVYECEWCGFGIYSGDEYVELEDNVRVCRKCIDFYTEIAGGKI